MGGYLFGQHQGIIQHMWLELFEACITTNSYLAELWTEKVEETKVGVLTVTRHKQIEMALQYFDQKCQPLRQIIEKVAFCGFSGEEELVCDNKHKLWGDRFSGEDERRNQASDSLHLDYLHLDLSSTCINVNNNNLETVVCNGEKKLHQSLMSSKTAALTVTPDSIPATSIMTTMTNPNRQEKTIATTSVTNSSPLTEIEICDDRKTDGWFVERLHDGIGDGANHNPLRTDDVEELKSSSSSIAYYNNNYHVLQRNKDKRQSLLQKYQHPEMCVNNHYAENNNSQNENPNNKNKAKKTLPGEQEPLLKISLENLRIYLCEKPGSSFDVIHSCSNNFEKLKYLRVKERESPSVRISCAFQQGYYLETLFPGRRIRNQSGKNNYVQHLQELNMSLSYSRQLRQFYKSFRRYRRFLHLYVPLRTILRNITRIREKIDMSEDETHFWSLLPTNNLRVFYECYSYWFGLNLCDVYTLLDVIDNYPAGTVDQFLESKCVQIFQCEGYVKALNWLQSIADRYKYLFVYKTVNRAHCVVVERDEKGWSYEKSFDTDKDNIIFAGFYIFIKHH